MSAWFIGFWIMFIGFFLMLGSAVKLDRDNKRLINRQSFLDQMLNALEPVRHKEAIEKAQAGSAPDPGLNTYLAGADTIPDDQLKQLISVLEKNGYSVAFTATQRSSGSVKKTPQWCSIDICRNEALFDTDIVDPDQCCECDHREPEPDPGLEIEPDPEPEPDSVDKPKRRQKRNTRKQKENMENK